MFFYTIPQVNSPRKSKDYNIYFSVTKTYANSHAKRHWILTFCTSKRNYLVIRLSASKIYPVILKRRLIHFIHVPGAFQTELLFRFLDFSMNQYWSPYFAFSNFNAFIQLVLYIFNVFCVAVNCNERLAFLDFIADFLSKFKADS